MKKAWKINRFLMIEFFTLGAEQPFFSEERCKIELSFSLFHEKAFSMGGFRCGFGFGFGNYFFKPLSSRAVWVWI